MGGEPLVYLHIIQLLITNELIKIVSLYFYVFIIIMRKDTQAKTLVPSQGDVVTESTVILCMRKKLGGGIFANLFAF